MVRISKSPGKAVWGKYTSGQCIGKEGGEEAHNRVSETKENKSTEQSDTTRKVMISAKD